MTVFICPGPAARAFNFVSGRIMRAIDVPLVKKLVQGTLSPWHEFGRKSIKNIPEKGAFMLVIPSPNVMRKLLLGHAFTNSVDDAITRYFISSL